MQPHRVSRTHSLASIGPSSHERVRSSSLKAKVPTRCLSPAITLCIKLGEQPIFRARADDDMFFAFKKRVSFTLGSTLSPMTIGTGKVKPIVTGVWGMMTP